MKKYIVSMLALASLYACSLPPYTPVTIKELFPVGSVLHLTQPIEIPAERSYIYIAGGKVVPLKPYNTVNIYYPYCTLHLRKISSQVRHVMPDQFTVTKVVEWEDYHDTYNNTGNNPGKFMRTASEGGLFKARRAAYKDDGGNPIVMYATIMNIYSAKQPEVKTLVCGHWDVLGTVEPLTLNEMKSALGDLIRVEIKRSGAI